MRVTIVFLVDLIVCAFDVNSLVREDVSGAIDYLSLLGYPTRNDECIKG